jgi:hypothetical protein
MKWCIEDSNVGPFMRKKIKRNLENGTITKETLEELLQYPSIDQQFTFRSDNSIFVDKLVNSIIGICYVKNFIFDIAIDDHRSIYKSKRIKNKQPKDNTKWYFTISKMTFTNDNTVSYHFHFSKQGKNCHILLIHDNDIVE